MSSTMPASLSFMALTSAAARRLACWSGSCMEWTLSSSMVILAAPTYPDLTCSTGPPPILCNIMSGYLERMNLLTNMVPSR